MIPMDATPDSRLKSDQTEVWRELNAYFGPLVVTDEFGIDASSPPPGPERIQWISLYALGVLLLDRSVKRELRQSTPLENIRYAHHRALASEFWGKQTDATSAFSRFAVRWGLSRYFPMSKLPQQTRGGWHDDEQQVLGLHEITSTSDIADYVLRWRNNPNITSKELLTHRVLVSRGVDLLCSELIANGLEHSQSHDKPSFLLAKLCSPQSSFRALEFNAHTPHLLPEEEQIYTLSESEGISVLQIAIGDRGVGFGGNTLLRAKYKSEFKSDPSEGALVSFALRGDVTTRSGRDFAEEWLKLVEKPDDLAPQTHGLAEVLHFAESAGALWRIHSNSALLSANFLRGHTSREVLTSNQNARNIKGCLHYFALPLYKRRYISRRSMPSKNLAPASGFRLIDASDYLFNKGKVGDSGLPDRVSTFCDTLLRQITHDDPKPVLLRLAAIDAMDESEAQNTCALLASVFHRLRKSAALFLLGVSDPTRSQLHRLGTVRAFLNTSRILPYVTLFPPEGQSEIEIDVPTHLEWCAAELTTLLRDGGSSVWRRADLTPERWVGLTEVPDANPALLDATITDDEVTIRAKWQLTVNKAALLAHGGYSPVELTQLIKKTRAAARAKTLDGYYYRLGQSLECYLHVARVWANPEFRNLVVSWMAAAVEELPAFRGKLMKGGEGITLVALLHPAIELAHSLIRTAAFLRSDIVEIRRLGDMRWDNCALHRIGATQVIIVTDFVSTGKTVMELQKHLDVLDVKVAGVLSIISAETQSLGVPHFSFCHTDKETFTRMLYDAAP